MMTEIVTSDGDDHTEDEIINFDKLKCLELNGLPGLISFCSGNNAFNFPALENVTVKGCSRMKIFAFGDLNTPKLRGILLGDQQRWEGNLNATLAEMVFAYLFLCFLLNFHDICCMHICYMFMISQFICFSLCLVGSDILPIF